MFIYETPQDLEILKEIKKEFSIVPPHWALLANLHPIRFKMFMQEIVYLLNHEKIHPDFFGMLRLYVANREAFSYCKSFNTKLLLAKGYEKDVLKAIMEDIEMIPLDMKHKILAKEAIGAIYEPDKFTLEKISTLKELAWSDSNIYDAVDHAAFLFKFSKIIKAYQS